MSTSSADKNKSLDVIGQLEEELDANPLDYGKWQKLIKLVLGKDKESQVEQVFKKYLNIFKYDGKQWRNLVEYELNRSQFDKVEKLFLKCSQTCKTVDLFRLYVSYVRRVNDVITGGEKARGVVIKAFDVSIAEVGIDWNSGDLWNDYLDFLKSWTPGTTWEKQQKIDLIRKVYKRFFSIPTKNIETMWAQYTRWENEVNASSAGRFISENSAEYMNSRSWNTEWTYLTGRQLIREVVPGDINNDVVLKQFNLWVSWVQFEAANHLHITDEKALFQRIEYIFQQCTMCLPFVPEVWFLYCSFLLRQNEDASVNKCIEIVRDGLVFSPDSLLLTFQLAELLEYNMGDADSNEQKASEGDNETTFDELKTVYTNLIHRLDQNLSRALERIEDIKQKATPIKEEPSVDDSEAPTQVITQYSELQKNDLRTLEEEVEKLRKSKTLAYVKLMLASKRTQGIVKCRGIFKEARMDKNIGHELYVQSALIEHYSDHKKTAKKVFELGLRTFGTNGDFLLRYLKYLISYYDVDNIRNLVQTSDTSILKEISLLSEERDRPTINDYDKETITRRIDTLKRQLKRIFKCYIDYAFSYLSLDLARTLISKYESLFPEDDPIDFFTSSRYLLGTRNIVKEMELGVRERDDDSDDDDERPKKRQATSAKKSSNNNNTGSSQNSANVDTLGRDIHFPTQCKSLFETMSESMGGADQYSPIGKNMYNLLRILPNASYFGSKGEYTFDSTKLVELLSNLPDQ